jgi:hypothetical protein
MAAFTFVHTNTIGCANIRVVGKHFQTTPHSWGVDDLYISSWVHPQNHRFGRCYTMQMPYAIKLGLNFLAIGTS